MHKSDSILAATKDAKFLRRFWAKVERRGPEDCWPWMASKHPGGYGQIGQPGSSTRIFRAHRVAWSIANGRLPVGLCVMHACDNPPCCNPAHLSLGTLGDNNRDAAAKGRSCRGERNGVAKLTEPDIKAIRSAYAAGRVKQGDLAQRYGVEQSHISAIIRRARWRHVD